MEEKKHCQGEESRPKEEKQYRGKEFLLEEKKYWQCCYELSPKEEKKYWEKECLLEEKKHCWGKDFCLE